MRLSCADNMVIWHYLHTMRSMVLLSDSDRTAQAATFMTFKAPKPNLKLPIVSSWP